MLPGAVSHPNVGCKREVPVHLFANAPTAPADEEHDSGHGATPSRDVGNVRLLTVSPLSDIGTNGRPGMYSVKEAAARLGVTDRHVRFLLAKGAIPGKRLGHDWVVLSLEYHRKRRPRTRGTSGARNKLGLGRSGVWMEGSL